MLKIIRKRKFEAEQLDLPIPKHKCWERPTMSDVPVSVEWLRLKGKTKELVIDHDDKKNSKPESMKDSNSYVDDYDSSTSILSEVKYTTVTTNEINSFSQFSSTSDDSTALKAVHYGKEEEEEEIAAMQGFLDLQEQLLEFGSYAKYHNEKSLEECTDKELAYANNEKSLEECTDKELQGFPCDNKLNSNVLVLSSGRWSVKEEVQSGRRKPTIDQEFEQYFSMLML